MSDNTGIEWTDATWNPVTGCDKVSAGCDHCYAETIAHRFAGTKAYPNGFQVTLRPERLDQPLRWKRPRRIFVNSMSDLFHDSVPDDYIAKVWAVMAVAERHTFQVLTKRHGRMRSLLSDNAFASEVAFNILALTEDDDKLPAQLDVIGDWWPLRNVWVGVSTEDQRWADIRIPALLDTPAAVRFISAEPLLGPIDFTRVPGFNRIGLDLSNWWVIVGGESGPGARPMHPDWVRGLRNQCEAAGVPFFLKQWGEWTGFNPPADSWQPQTYVNRDTGECLDEAAAIADGGSFTGVWRVGKKRAGRELDGRTWDQYPEAVTV